MFNKLFLTDSSGKWDFNEFVIIKSSLEEDTFTEKNIPLFNTLSVPQQFLSQLILHLDLLKILNIFFRKPLN